MANWCENDIRISSPKRAVINEIFSSFVDNVDGKWEIEKLIGGEPVRQSGASCVRETDFTLAISFFSAWSPPLDEMAQIAEEYDCKIVIEWNEPGMGCCGIEAFQHEEDDPDTETDYVE